MKKYILTIMPTLILANLLIVNSAYSRTVGSYAGVSAIFSEGTFNERYNSDKVGVGHNIPFDDTERFNREKGGFGLNYSYAFNQNGLFVMPEIFYERNNLVIAKNPPLRQRQLEISNRFGLKLNIGYDLTRNFSPFISAGYSGIDYTSTNYRDDNQSISSQNQFLKGAPLFGAGIMMNVNSYFALSLEGNYQEFKARTYAPERNNNHHGNYLTRLTVIKLNLNYRF